MTKQALKLILYAVILVLCQVIVFNHVCLFHVAVPFVFIYVIMRLPLTLSVNWVLTVSFLLGLIVDVFSDTQGMNALACTFIGMLRKPVLGLYFPREDELTDPELTMRTLGAAVYIKYVLTLSLIYCAIIFVIESFALFDVVQMILRISSSTLLTAMLIIGVDTLTLKRREKRL